MSTTPLVMCHPPPSVSRRPEGEIPVECPPRVLMFLSDGQVRFRGYEEGYTEGRRTILRFVEASARGRFGLRAVISPLFSAMNVRHRSEKLLRNVSEQLAWVYAEYLRGRALVGVVVKCYGDLDGLKRMGGFAARVAYQIEALCDATADTRSPTLVWWLAVAYGPEVLLDLGVDAVLRTAMEEPRTLRLSNLDPHPGAALMGVTTLGPAMTLDRLDEAIHELGRCGPVPFETGYSLGLATDILSALAQQPPAEAFAMVLPVNGSPADLARLAADHAPALARKGVALGHVLGANGATFARAKRTRLERRALLVSPAMFRVASMGEPATAWLVPTTGNGRTCRLSSLHLGDANAHLCDTTPTGLIGALLRALRFSARHKALHGGERDALHDARAHERRRQAAHLESVGSAIVRDPLAPAEKIAKRWADLGPTRERPLHWDVAAMRELQLARASGLLARKSTWEKAALGYAYTAVITAYRAPTDADPTGETWEKTVRLLAPVLMAVACTDEDVFERWSGERAEVQWARCGAAAPYLIQRALGDRYLCAPDVAGWEQLVTVAAFWERLREDRTPVAHPLVLGGFFQAIADLYTANLFELDTTGRRAATSAVLRGCVPGDEGNIESRRLPPTIRERMSALAALGPEESTWRSARLRLAVLHDLWRTHPSIAAGVVCRALAMMTPPASWSPEAIELHERVADLMDWSFRLHNDLASLNDSAAGDRDCKDNAWTVLVPIGATEKAREDAVAEAVAACQDVREWLDDDLDHALGDLATVAPRLCTMVSRAVHFGRQAYRGKHYSKLDLGDLHEMGDSTLRQVG